MKNGGPDSTLCQAAKSRPQGWHTALVRPRLSSQKAISPLGALGDGFPRRPRTQAARRPSLSEGCSPEGLRSRPSQHPSGPDTCSVSWGLMGSPGSPSLIVETSQVLSLSPLSLSRLVSLSFSSSPDAFANNTDKSHQSQEPC